MDDRCHTIVINMDYFLKAMNEMVIGLGYTGSVLSFFLLAEAG
jgi:hypothetical protein